MSILFFIIVPHCLRWAAEYAAWNKERSPEISNNLCNKVAILHQMFNCSETVPVVHTQAATPTGCVFWRSFKKGCRNHKTWATITMKCWSC